jgi:D-aminopeptidase
MQGVAGIVDWARCLATDDDDALDRDPFVGEVNAAIGGAVAARATETLANDAHSFHA